MSYAIPYEETAEVEPAVETPSAERSRWIWVPFLFPVLVSAVSWLAGGVPLITDVAFLFLTLLCCFYFCVELVRFPQRQGIGGILIFGGVLVWFCHDYFTNWFLRDYHALYLPGAGISAAVVARAAFFHCLFILLMLVSLPLRIFTFVDKAVVAVPEPGDRRFYFGLLIFMMILGWSAFFASDEPYYLAFSKGALWYWLGQPKFNVWRTGNMNYNWSGYIAQVLQLGQVGGVYAAFYALMIARRLPAKLFGWLCWLYWCSYSYTGERRGDMAFMILPVVALLFLKYGGRAVQLNRSRIAGYILAGVAAFGLWYLIQVQNADRTGTGEVIMFRAAGNTMFSEGLQAWAIIPEFHDYAYNTFPGETIVRPIPDTLFQFITGPIPRALWRNKPGPDDFALWYSSYISGDNREANTGGVIGSTVSGGAVGGWYFRFGPAGVIEGALLYGWLMGVAERSFRRANGKPIALLFSLGFATFMFRSYRDLWWHNLDPLLLAWILMWAVIKLFFSAPPAEQAAVEA